MSSSNGGSVLQFVQFLNKLNWKTQNNQTIYTCTGSVMGCSSILRLYFRPDHVPPLLWWSSGIIWMTHPPPLPMIKYEHLGTPPQIDSRITVHFLIFCFGAIYKMHVNRQHQGIVWIYCKIWSPPPVMPKSKVILHLSCMIKCDHLEDTYRRLQDTLFSLSGGERKQ